MQYDAQGNLISDTFHTYTYDAEGHTISVDGGSTASYVYNALNQRVRTVVGTTATEFVFNAAGQRVSIWNGTTGVQLQGQYYWGGKRVAFYSGGSAHFQYQNWVGTERMRTTYNGGAEGTFTSLPFGDGQVTSGSDLDSYHYAMLDHDTESDTDHAQFRQYSNAQGRLLSPDPYYGSYDLSNPQSFNRYAYALNNPLSMIDPAGLMDCNDNNTVCVDGGGYGCGDPNTVCVDGGGDACYDNNSVCIDGGPGPGGSGGSGGAGAPNNKVCSSGGDPGMLPASLSLVAGGELTYGGPGSGPNGVSYQPTVGAFQNLSNIRNWGTFNSKTTYTSVAGGAYAGVGVGGMLSNANNASQLQLTNSTITISTPIGSVSWSTGGGVWEFQVTAGPGLLLGVSKTVTQTNVTRNTQPCP